jgi:hypothetical protein
VETNPKLDKIYAKLKQCLSLIFMEPESEV